MFLPHDPPRVVRSPSLLVHLIQPAWPLFGGSFQSIAHPDSAPIRPAFYLADNPSAVLNKLDIQQLLATILQDNRVSSARVITTGGLTEEHSLAN